MNFFVFGVNHKKCPVEVRERLSFNAGNLSQAFSAAARSEEISELVILSTCNRVEFIGTYAGASPPVEEVCRIIAEVLGVQREAYLDSAGTLTGRDAIRYIFRVAAGLESLVVGENEILGQVREAFRLANASGTVHSVLYRLMEKALKTGKEVRHQTKINEGAVSIPSVAVELAEKIFGRLRGERVMVLGTGQMGVLTLKNLKDAGAEILYVVSRARESGEEISAEFGAGWLSFTEWHDRLADVDILIASTSSPSPVVTHPAVEQVMARRRHRPLFLIDIAVPRDIEASIHSIDDVYLYNIDDLKGVADANLKLRSKEVHDAEKVTDAAVEAFSSWLAQLEARPVLASFEGYLDGVLEKELGCSGLDDEKKKELKEKIRSRLLHAPIHKIKEASRNGGVHRYLEALQALFKLEEKEDKS